MKKKKNTNNIKNKTTKRWRPTKSFVSKKPKIKRDGPWRPKKHEQPILPEIPEKKENKIKDTIILTLFVLSFFIFWFSIYINQKNTPIETNIEKQEVITEIWETNINTAKISNQTGAIIEDEKSIILLKIYWYLQESKIDEIYWYIDNTLKQSSTFKTYFSRSRLQRFIDNIDDKSLKIEETKIDNESWKVTYKVSYSIKNIIFVEERETNFITRDNEQKIAKIMCITKGCSKMPFFNPGKYF